MSDGERDTLPARPDTSEWGDRQLLEAILDRTFEMAQVMSSMARDIAELKRQVLVDPNNPRTIGQHVGELINMTTYLHDEQRRLAGSNHALRQSFTELEGRVAAEGE